jgi:hypothetical protein
MSQSSRDRWKDKKNSSTESSEEFLMPAKWYCGAMIEKKTG